MLGQIISHYRIVEKIGEGATGVVYAAEHTLLGKRVALKTLKAAHGGQHQRARFLREARAVSGLNHPNIAAVYDYGEIEDGRPFIVMELVKGQTLGELLTGGALTLPRAVEVVAEVAEALSEAHRNGIVHRDIKPSNVIISERGQVKVLDFGLAKTLSDVAGTEVDPKMQAHLLTQTCENVLVGTPLYLSPEQALGLPVDERSDIFTLGSLLYECLTGRLAFSGRDLAEIRARVIRDDPAPPSEIDSEIPAELSRVTLKALAKRAEDRYQSSEEFLAGLRAAAGALGGTKGGRNFKRLLERGVGAVSRLAHRPRNLAAAALITILLVAGLWGVWRVLRKPVYQPSPGAMRWYEGGVAALRDGTFQTASRSLEEAVRQDDNFALAHARLAEALTELGYTERANAEMMRANALIMNGRYTLPPQDASQVQAINAIISRDFSKAVESYRGLIGELPEAETARAYGDLGRAYEKSEDWKKAVESYEEATRRDPQYAAAFLRLGSLYGRQQELQKAEQAFDRAEKLYEAQTNVEGASEVAYQRAALFLTKGDLAKAREESQRALEVAQLIQSPSQKIKILLQRSRILTLSGETAQAKENTAQAITLAQESGIPDFTTQGLIELGNAFFRRLQIDEAKNYYHQALDLALAYNQRANAMRALLSLGSLHIQQDEVDEGLPYVKQALPFYEQGGYRKETMQAQSLLGQAYGLRGDYEAARAAFEQQLKLAGELNNQTEMARAHKGIGTALAYQEKYPAALKEIAQSYSIYSAQGDQLNAGYSQIASADVLWRLGRYEEARAALNQVASVAEQPEGEFRSLWLRINLTRAHMALSEMNFPEAVAKGREVITADDSKIREAAAEATYVVGLARARAGAANEGERACASAAEMAKSTGDPRPYAEALLALAEASLGRDARAAADDAREAADTFTRIDEPESAWRAALVAGLASLRLGDNRGARASLSQASGLLAGLAQRWGAEDFEHYLARPDIARQRKQLNETSAAAQ